jgi:hypothetical protein
MKGELIMAVFVDNTLACSIYNEEIENLVILLKSKFDINNIDEPAHFFEIALIRNGIFLTLSQKYYLKNVLKRFYFKNIKAKSISINFYKKFEKFKEKLSTKYKAVYAFIIEIKYIVQKIPTFHPLYQISYFQL